MTATATLSSLETWLSGEAAKIKAAVPTFEATAIADFDAAKTAVAGYAGPLAAELVDVFKLLNPSEIQAFATAILPSIESKIVAGLGAINITGSAATALAQSAASAVVTAIVSAVTTAIAAPK